jgi:serine/threonine protein kinase
LEDVEVSSLSDKSSRRQKLGVEASNHSSSRIVLSASAEPAPTLAGEKIASDQLPHASEGGTSSVAKTVARGSSIGRMVREIEMPNAVPSEDRTVISKRSPAEDLPPPIHIGALDSRKSLEGETVDHFQILEYVGGGGMGAVYRGLDTRLNRPVAVKILSRDQADSETVRRFRNEAQSAARLDHPNISRVYYIGEDKGWNFIVFEFIEGQNLRNRVEKLGPLPFDEALSYTLQIAEALDHAQARDVVHRDIKPSNILVDEQGSIKLVDMGLARSQQLSPENEDLTASGVTLGTFDYISPEQARDPRTADVRSDMYSLGCTLYFMLAGRPPFPEGTALQKLLWHTGDDPPDVRLFRPEVPDAFVALLTRLLAKKPEQRFQTAQELIQALIQISQRHDYGVDASSVKSMTPNWPEKITASTAPWWQQYMPILVAALLLLAVALWPEDSSSKPALPVLPASATPAVTLANMTPTIPIASGNDAGTKTDAQGLLTIPKPTASGTSAVTPESIPGVEKQPVEKQTAVEPSPEMKVVSPGPTENKTNTPAPDTTPVIAVHTVIVKPNASASEYEVEQPGTTWVESLPDAFRFAANHPECTAIELAYNGSQVVTRAVEMGSRRLTLRPATGFQPELIFRPSPDEELRTCLQIRPAESMLTFENIRLRAEFPNSNHAWSLIQLPAEASLEISQTVFTLINSTAGMRHANACAIVHCMTSGEAVAREENTETPMSRLVVRNSVLRGDANVCQIAEDHPVRFTITDSFVATSGHFLETSGLTTKPRWMDRIRLTIQQCTLVNDAGLLLAGIQNELPFRMEVRLDLESNVIIANRANPLLEYRGGEASEEAKISFEGSNNYYPRTNTFFRRQLLQNGLVSTLDSPLDDLPRWARDRNAEQGYLPSPPADLAWHDATLADFLLKNANEEAVGCQLDQLPVVESTVRRPIKNATNMGGMNPDLPAPITAPIMDDKANMRPTTIP